MICSGVILEHVVVGPKLLATEPLGIGPKEKLLDVTFVEFVVVVSVTFSVTFFEFVVVSELLLRAPDKTSFLPLRSFDHRRLIMVGVPQFESSELDVISTITTMLAKEWCLSRGKINMYKPCLSQNCYGHQGTYVRRVLQHVWHM